VDSRTGGLLCQAPNLGGGGGAWISWLGGDGWVAHLLIILGRAVLVCLSSVRGGAGRLISLIGSMRSQVRSLVPGSELIDARIGAASCGPFSPGQDAHPSCLGLS
jgi:hypothetical protein